MVQHWQTYDPGIVVLSTWSSPLSFPTRASVIGTPTDDTVAHARTTTTGHIPCRGRINS